MRTLANWALGIGVLVGIAGYSGWLSWLAPSALNVVLTLAGLALLGGVAVLAGAWAYDLYRDRFPTSERREAMAANAMSLGLRSIERDASTLDLGFRFFRRGRRGLLTRSATRELISAVRPRVDWIFTGSWRGVDVRLFDFMDQTSDTREWTCATLPLGRSLPPISITRRDAVTGSVGRLLDRGFRSGDAAFDSAFHVEADDPATTLGALDATARACLLKSAPPFPCVVEVDQGRLLVCGPRVPPDDRRHLLEAAVALGVAFAPVSH